MTFAYMSRTKKHFTDVKATLASMIEIPGGSYKRPIDLGQRDEMYCLELEIEEEDHKPWYADRKQYLGDKTFPADATKNDLQMIQRLAH